MNALLIMSVILGSCQPLQYHSANPSKYQYGQYRDLADALKSISGLRVVGFSRNTRIEDTRNPDHNSVQYILDGVFMFDDYNLINDQIQMSRVQSIKIRKSVASRVSVANNDRTIVEIWTQ